MTFETVNPATGEKLNSYSFSNEAEIDQALGFLDQSFLKWRKLTHQQRQSILKKLALNLNEKAEFFAKLMSTEMGKPIKEARLEVKKCVATIQSYCEKDLSFLNPQNKTGVYKKSQITHEPLGVIYSIMPWNFPLWQVIRMVVPALLSGNVILLKHSEITIQTGLEFEKLFQGLWTQPLLFHRMIQHELTEKVMQDVRVQGVSLTGSTTAGLSIAKAAGAALKKYVLELGGSDPYLILDDAPLEKAAAAIAKGRLMNTGQSCICVKRCLVHHSRLDEFLIALKKQFDQFQFGNPLDEKTDLGPLAHPRFKEALKRQLADLQKNTGAEKVYQKKHQQTEDSAFVDAEIYLLPKNSDWLKEQEFFAPVLLVIPFKDDAEAVQIANATVYALGAGVWTSDLQRGEDLASQLVAGQVAVNDLIKSDAELPFGGFKKSGLGRELGEAGFFEFTQTKVISNSL